MTTAQSKLTSQGQVSVPAAIRSKLGLGPGSMLEWHVEDGSVVVRRAVRHSSEDIHQSLFAATPKPRTAAELKEGIRQHLRKRHARA